jgi:hypothetical protein
MSQHDLNIVIVFAVGFLLLPVLRRLMWFRPVRLALAVVLGCVALALLTFPQWCAGHVHDVLGRWRMAAGGAIARLID